MASAMLALFILLAPIIYFFAMVFFTFDANCTEDSHPVALARSLSQDQLADLNARVMELKEQYPYAQLTNFDEPFIPDDLKYLKARYVSFQFGDPYIVLAKCNVSVGVTLWLHRSREGRDTIELTWDAVTDDTPSGSEILWTGPTQGSL